MVAFIVAIPIGAVGADGYVNPDPFTNQSDLTSYIPSNLPFTCAFIYQVGSFDSTDTGNFTISTPSLYLAEGAYFTPNQNTGLGTITNPTLWAYSDYRNDIDIIDDDGTILYDIFDNNYLDTLSSELLSVGLYNYDTGTLEKIYNTLSVHVGHCVGIRDPSLGSAIYPYGYLLKASNLVLVPKLYEEYMTPSLMGSNGVLGGIGGVSGIGGMFIKLNDMSTYDSATLHYKITYYTQEGVRREWRSPVVNANELKDYYYNTLHIPIIPISFMQETDSQDYIYIVSAECNFHSPYRYQNNSSATNFYYLCDNLWLTNYDVGADDYVPLGGYPLNDALSPIVMAHYTQNQKHTEIFNEWYGFTGWVGDAVGGVLNVPLGYGVTFGGIIVVVMSFSFVMWFMKNFAGG